MHIESFLWRTRIIVTVVAAALLLLPFIALGEGGGGSDGGANDVSVTVNGATVGTSNAVTGQNAVSNVSFSQGSLSGTWGGMDVSYNPSSGSWEGSMSGQGGESAVNAGNIISGCVSDSGDCDGGHAADPIPADPSSCPAGTTPYFDPAALINPGNASYYWAKAPGWAETIIRWNSSYTAWPWADLGTSYTSGDYTYYRGGARGYGTGPAGGYFGYYEVCRKENIPPPAVTLNANPLEVDYNKSSTLTWTSSHTTSCSASGGWSGSRSLNDQTGQTTGPLTQATNFALTCQGQPGTTPARSEKTVRVRVGEDADIVADKTTVRKDDEIELDWNVGTSLPENCEIRAGSTPIAGPLTAKSGTITHHVVGETVFTLHCDGGQNAASVTVKVLPEFQET